MLRADIDAAGRVEAEQCLEAVRQPTRDHHLLLIAAAEPTQFRFRARVDPESADRRRHAFALAAQRYRSPSRDVAKRRQSDILAN